MKQLLLKMNTDTDRQFIIEDLDETHLLVDPAQVAVLKEKFAEALEENVYKLDAEVKATF